MNVPPGNAKTSVNEPLSLFQETLATRNDFPGSTYRLQLNRGFTFSMARNVLAYLFDLGVSHCYTSPILAAGKNSPHGYDTSDFTKINPELGGEAGYDAFAEELSRMNMGHLLDFVPNHMGIADSKNNWWQDVLENGRCSPYAEFFDIDWNPAKAELKGKILLPILADQYGVVLEQGDLHLNFAEGTFFLNYFDHRLPVNPQSIPIVLSLDLENLQNEIPADDPEILEFLSIITACNRLPGGEKITPEKIEERIREKQVNRDRLQRLWDESSPIRRHIQTNLKLFNGTSGQADSFDPLHQLLEKQIYRLSNWRTAVHEINYRRFFDVNHLVGIRVEIPGVFHQTHALILKLIGAGKISGLRLDHIDGLFDPAAYFNRLQEEILFEYIWQNEQLHHQNPNLIKEMVRQWRKTEALADPAGPEQRPMYLAAEKILTGTETLPEHWAIHGTSGYDFMNDLNGLFVDASNEKNFSKIYIRFTGVNTAFQEIVYHSKKLIIETALTSELNILVRALNMISEDDRRHRDFTLNSLREALREVVACFPIYRTYIDAEGSNPHDTETLQQSIARAKSLNPAMESTIFDFIQDTVQFCAQETVSENRNKHRRDFVMKLQQFTGPVQAKGLEDTAFYRYNRLISLNEVGGQPQRFGLSVSGFHARNLKRQKNWPHTMTATATHDHKRGEDARARINILSEIPDDWRKAIRRWALLNRSKRSLVDGGYAPDRNDEYLFYQTLVGMWPLATDMPLADIKTRLVRYMHKAGKEAKVHTSWINPNNAYDMAVEKFIDKALKPSKSNRFLDSFLSFHGRIARMGAINSLAQVLIKITSPGVPDTYQGCELWDFSLVDPDNRQPVDFDKRKHLLKNLQPLLAVSTEEDAKHRAELLLEMLDHWENGQIKLFVTACCLHFRRKHPDLFLEGDYLPLQVTGEQADHVVAFARYANGKFALTVAPRLVAGLMEPELNWPVKSAWGNTHVLLPPGLSGQETLVDLFTRQPLSIATHDGQSTLDLKQIFNLWPFALLSSNL
ncbi:Malto-oligosyltrehalose synthase [hydrothermal vent metagenome]|uniref:Malto-oligosyltrehalose synthase n=1 Tax=hydrothermal vent metagenome TaxID=652676 RepID=A0A3B1DAJ5_9ZZZZ